MACSWAPAQVLTGLASLVAVILWFFFPDSPVDARFLTPEERILAVKRVAEAKLGVKNTQFKWYQVRGSVLSRRADPSLTIFNLRCFAVE